ncbi:MAG: hypothetical protein IKB07_10950 [Lachnospiraceae bacterium]|nr:hypothetical protein [Lachnospiraceae bacterium]
MMKQRILGVVILLSMLLMCGAGACSGSDGDDYPFPTLAPDWSNRTSEEMPGAYGGWFNLWKSRGGVGTDWEKKVLRNAMLDREVTTKDGTINVFLNYSFTEGEYKGEKTMKTVILVTVNDEICDFTLDGQTSEKGLLITEKPMGKELTEALSVEKCNLVKGDNELAVYVAVYYPSGFVTATSISRIFVSEVEQICNVDYGYDVKELSGSEVVTSEGKDEREIRSWLGKTTDFLYDKISFNSSNRCMTVATDSEIQMSFPNQRGDEKPVARQGIVLVLKNGEPIGAWDGELIGRLTLTDTDLNVTLPITVEKEAEEYAHLTFVFFDADHDVGTFFTERLFYFQ